MATATVPTTRPTVKPTTLAKLNRCDHVFIGNDHVIASATELGKLYRVGNYRCTCEAGKRGIKCWHQEARTYLLATQPQPTTAGPRTPDEIDEQTDRHEVVVIPPRKKRMTDAEYEALAESLNQDFF